MAPPLTDAEVEAALAECAAEPVHIPGTIQPYGCLIAVSAGTDTILSASENVDTFLGTTAQELLGQSAREAMGSPAWHGVRNAASREGIAQQAAQTGVYEINGADCEMRVFQTANRHVIEIEPKIDTGLEGPEALKTLSYLMAQIQACDSEQKLFDLTVGLMQLLSGFDRVMVYRFDRSFNGEVLAEAKRSSMPSFLNLRFPHWDIPSQARAIMAKLPLRFICDSGMEPVRLVGAADDPPLDLTLANLRGVSPVHMEYLRNMGSAATMTLSIMVEEKLWGMISFHHMAPRVPAPGLRDVLVNFLLVFSSKLLSLRQQTALHRIETLNRGFIAQQGEAPQTNALVKSAAPLVLDAMRADGIAVVSEHETFTHGAVPGPDVLSALTEEAQTAPEGIAIDALSEHLPEYAEQLGTTAGALVVGNRPSRSICLFRNALAQEISWAGNPEKEIETIDGRTRLSPRGSFSTYLEQVEGRSEPWSDNDVHLTQHLRTALHTAERETLLNRLNQQQELLIGELNHRVRNILALVRSVSRQARRRYGSLESYANAIENRIRALAFAHDLSSGNFSTSVSMQSLINMEFEPFRTLSDNHITIDGPDWPMKPQVAPIFSLVVHELVTNAAKYGALSRPYGFVTVRLERRERSCAMLWLESGGPSVKRPKDKGFGMAMIERAVPHELGGTAKVEFEPDGVRAEFTIPLRHFAELDDTVAAQATRLVATETFAEAPEALAGGTALVLEDNFIIAAEMADQLKEMGVADVDICSTIEDALTVLERGLPTFAVLDINLGYGMTSEPVGTRLKELGVPFLFVSGYNEEANMPGNLSEVPRLTKPTSMHEVVQVLKEMFADKL